MDKFVTRFKATNYGHCIIKEELIISESDDEADKKTVDKTNDPCFSNSDVEPTTNQKCQNGRLGNKKVNGQINKQSTLDSFLKSTTSESNERSENSKNVTDNKKPSVASFKTNNIDLLLKRHTKSYCGKCKVKRAVIRQKARCPRCKTQLSYSCESCDKTYTSFTELGYHLKAHHTQRRKLYICPKCEKAFSYRGGLREHQIRHHQNLGQCSKFGKICKEETRYKCSECPFQTYHRSNLISHIKERHSNFKEKCGSCNKEFTNARSLKRHQKVYCKKTKSLECDHCGHKVYRKDQMVIHLNQFHFHGHLTPNDLRGPRTCRYCGLTLKLHGWMTRHLKQCESAPLELRRQSEKKATKASRSCQYCGLRLGRFVRLKIHLERCESAPSEFRRQPRRELRSCQYCDLTLKRHEHMRYHLERCVSAPLELRRQPGTADQPDLDTAIAKLAKFYCVKCKTKKPLKFRSRRCGQCDSLLKFICEKCPKSFGAFNRLREHLRIEHVQNRTFLRCDKCHSSYTREKDLKLHKRICHSTKPMIKNYKCTKCDKSYSRRASLRKHIVSCSQEPKFFCDKCPYKTHFKSSLLDHLRAKRATCI